jgi:hypothetical protein
MSKFYLKLLIQTSNPQALCRNKMARKFELLSSLLNNTQMMFTKKYLMITAIALSMLVTLTNQIGSYITPTIYARCMCTR